MTDPSWKGAELEQRVVRGLGAFGYDAASPRGQSTLGELVVHWAGLVLDWNERMDLTAARDADELIDLLIADAAFIAGQALPGERRWVDIGSGAGAPGLGIALLAPELEVTLVEPKAKRVAFLRAVLAELGRPDVRIERARSDALARQSFDVAVSRATLPPPAWVVEGARLAHYTVWVLLAQAGPPDAPSGFRKDLDQGYRWPLGGAERRAVRFRRGAIAVEKSSQH
jgi:16S rRNA (guanine527-N7)-methyltransferase